MKNTLETRLGLFFALSVIAAFLLFELAGGGEFFRKGYTVNADFKNVHDLKAGDPVKMAGKQIGRVEDVDFYQNKVRATLKIESKYQVKTDSQASIKFLGLMGQNYISVTLGSPTAEKMASGGVLETVEQPDVSALMSRLENVAVGVENVTKSFSGDSIQNVLGPITDLVKNNSDNLTASIADLRTNLSNMKTVSANMKDVSDRIERGEGTIGKLIKDEQFYYTTLGTVKKLEETADSLTVTLGDARKLFADARGTIQNASNIVTKAGVALDEMKAGVADVRQGKGSIGKMMTDDALYTNLVAATANMRQIMEKINQGQGSVGKLVNDESLFRNVKMTLQKLEKATEGLEDTGPLSVLGTAVSNLF